MNHFLNKTLGFRDKIQAAAQEAAESPGAQNARSFYQDKRKEIVDKAPFIAGQAADWYATKIVPSVLGAVKVIKDKRAEAVEATPAIAEKVRDVIKEKRKQVSEAAPGVTEKVRNITEKQRKKVSEAAPDVAEKLKDAVPEAAGNVLKWAAKTAVTYVAVRVPVVAVVAVVGLAACGLAITLSVFKKRKEEVVDEKEDEDEQEEK